jgi:hypothetical protein
MVAAPENSPFVNATFRSIGTIHSVEGKSEGNGAITPPASMGIRFLGWSNLAESICRDRSTALLNSLAALENAPVSKVAWN